MRRPEEHNLSSDHEAVTVYRSLDKTLRTMGSYGLDAFYADITIPGDVLSISDYHTASCGVATQREKDYLAARTTDQSIISLKSESLADSFCAFRPIDITAPRSIMGMLLLRGLPDDFSPYSRAVFSLNHGFHSQPLTNLPGLHGIISALNEN